MALELHLPTLLSSSLCSPYPFPKISTPQTLTLNLTPRGLSFRTRRRRSLRPRSRSFAVSASLPTLDLTEDNIRKVLIDAKSELAQIFDASVGMTGQVDLADLDGPYVKLRLKGRFWHTRATVLARVGNYLKNRIPEILEVDIEDDKQLDDSPANF